MEYEKYKEKQELPVSLVERRFLKCVDELVHCIIDK